MVRKRKNASLISEITNALMDPILAKKAGINTMLLEVWSEIVGPEFADSSRPDKIIWPQKQKMDIKNSELGGGLTPGQLTIACEGSRALFLSHQQDEIITRINSFFGFPAINRIKIVQKNIIQNGNNQNFKNKARNLSNSNLSNREQQKLSCLLKGVDNPKLKEALTKLGKAILTKD